MALIHRVLKTPFFGRREKVWFWPKNANPDDWEAVSVRSGNGARLQAIVGAPRIEALGVIVMAHPMVKAAKGFWLKNGHAELFREHGYHVIAFDFNGFGQSESTTFDYPADVYAVGLYARERFANLPTAVIGASFGAGWALCALAKPDQPFKAAILEAAFPTLPDFWHHYPFPHFMLRASKYFYPAWEKMLRPVEAAKNINGDPSILLIFASADRYTPPDYGRPLVDAIAKQASTTLWTVKGADHTTCYQDAPLAYSNQVLTFLQRAFSNAS